ncbi:MAG: glutamine--tRNA ligase, partial [Chitinophagaceae bacterium]
FRRRGYTPESIHLFCEKIGVARRENLIDTGLLEFCLREHLNKIAKRVMVVMDPVKLVITNYPDGKVEELTSEDLPDEGSSIRVVPFSKELWIEREDFMEVPEKKWFRLAPGQMVRLKSAYIIKCDEVIKGSDGTVNEIHCSHVPESRSGNDTSGLQVKGTIHWVCAKHAIDIETRIYEKLFTVEDLNAEEGDFKDYINPDSLKVISAKAEPSLKTASTGDRYQFIRKGYFVYDRDSTSEKLVFNRSVTLKDTFVKKK